VAAGLGRLEQHRRRRPAVWAFLGVFAATLTCFLAVGAVLPVLPRYVSGPLGAGDLAVGIVIGSFAATALVGRPVGGRMADRVGRRRIHVIGLVLVGLGGLLYLLPFGVPGLILARLVLGLGDGWVFTAGVTWAVDLAPGDRRGQAIGYFGLSVWGGLTLGALLGEGVLALSGYTAVWLVAAGLPLVGALISRALPEPGAGGPAVAPASGRGSLVPREALGPGSLLALANVGYGTMAAFVVLHLEARGIGHGAATFVAFSASVVLGRVLLGTLPDRIGPRRASVAAAVAQAAGLALVAAAQVWAVALAGAMVMGLGSALLFPSLALLVVQRVEGNRRGAAMGAFTSFFDAGVGLGAPLAGAIAAARGYPAAFWMAAGLASVSALAGAIGSARR
jgi:MFS family permease